MCYPQGGVLLWPEALSCGTNLAPSNLQHSLLRPVCYVQISQANLTLVDDPRLQDGLQQAWDAATVASYVAATVEQLQPDLVRASRCLLFPFAVSMRLELNAGIWTLQIVTFDPYGVSGHPNHIATYRGVLTFLQQHRDQPWVQRLEVQVLVGVLHATSAVHRFGQSPVCAAGSRA